MAYKSEIYDAVKLAFEKKQERHENELRMRKADAYTACPEIKEIDNQIILQASEITKDILANGNAKKKILSIQKAITALNEQKQALLNQLGYPADYLDMHYDCEICHDTGYNGVKTCKCVQAELKKAAFGLSTLGSALRDQTFDSFSLSYYPENVVAGMEKTLNLCKQFALSVGSSSSQSIMFVGGTGLGKTHLASAIANVAVERGKSVVYITAPEMFSIFEDEKFGRLSKSNIDSAEILNCDLLIIDDLGTEYTTPLCISSLFTVLNTRSINSRNTLITTNSSMRDLENNYNDKIVSRVMGEYIIIPFKGNDIRLIKRQNTHL